MTTYTRQMLVNEAWSYLSSVNRAIAGGGGQRDDR
jgi:hypothetical protein